MANYQDFYRQSIDHPAAFWAEQAQAIDWHTPPQRIVDYSQPPFARWFVGGTTNLCHNAVDRHLAQRAQQVALIAVSTETQTERSYTFAQLHQAVQTMASVMQSLGVKQGDRVLIYMPMVAEAVFAMLACARIGAIHSVVFGGFAANALASRIDDATPRLVVSADAGSRGGKVLPYKPLLDGALALAQHQPQAVLLTNRKLAPMELTAGRDHLWDALQAQHAQAQVPCTWVESNHPSYTLYTSGTTGKPKGVQRDTGGYAVALAASMRHIFCGQAGETFFSTSDIGWVVGHSYIVYGPLLAGMATVLYEGLPTRPDAGVWWSLVQKYQVNVMFSAPTAVRVLKKQAPEFLSQYDLSSLRALFLAGEPLDEPTASWISQSLGKPVIDNYWQTETGWPILTLPHGVEKMPSKLGSPGVAMYGYNVKLIDENTGLDIEAPQQKGVLAIEGPLPPGCLQTVWQDDARFVKTYWSSVPERRIYSTFDWGVRDADGYFYILGRTDDVINVAGHRLGTREIEESIASHAQASEVAVVGVAHALKGQVAVAFVVVRDAELLNDPTSSARLEAEVMQVVDQSLGAVGRPARVYFVNTLPKTRSGKLLRRAIQAVCEQRDPGDLSTMEDPSSLLYIQTLLRVQPIPA